MGVSVVAHAGAARLKIGFIAPRRTGTRAAEPDAPPPADLQPPGPGLTPRRQPRVLPHDSPGGVHLPTK
jgi:hypothetical protein